jgi:hypothetical protein
MQAATPSTTSVYNARASGPVLRPGGFERKDKKRKVYNARASGPVLRPGRLNVQ